MENDAKESASANKPDSDRPPARISPWWIIGGAVLLTIVGSALLRNLPGRSKPAPVIDHIPDTVGDAAVDVPTLPESTGAILADIPIPDRQDTRSLRPEIARHDPLVDGWLQEIVVRAADDILDRLAELLCTSGDQAAAYLQTLSGQKMQVTALRPDSPARRYSLGTLEIIEADSQKTLRSGQEGVSEAFNLLLETFSPPRPDWVDFTIGRVLSETKEEIVLHLVFEAGGKRNDAPVYINADWEVTWAKVGGGRSLQPANIVVHRYREVVTPAPVFVDATTAVVTGRGGNESLLLHGTTAWRSRLDAAAGGAFGRFNGQAVGDVDGDRREDIYVLLPGGIPNVLLRQNADGTASDVAPQAGVDFLNDTRSALLIDIDNDGDRDLICAFAKRLVVAANDGQARFTVSADLPVDAPGTSLTSLTAADYDNDGDLDLYVCNGGFDPGDPRTTLPPPEFILSTSAGPPNVLFQNDGAGHFIDATEAAGLNVNNHSLSRSAIWQDDDNDGDMDLLVINDFGLNNLYRNDNGFFADVAGSTSLASAGIRRGAAWTDIDGDGQLELCMGNIGSLIGRRVMSTEQFRPGIDSAQRLAWLRLAGGAYWLDKSGQSFSPVPPVPGLTGTGWTASVSLFDANNDGELDMYLAEGLLSEGPADAEGFFWRRVVQNCPQARSAPDPYFVSWSALQAMLRQGFSLAGGQRNRMLLKTAEGYVNAGACGGADLIDDGRSVATCDWDRDGDLDLWCTGRTGRQLYFLRNDTPPSTHSLTIELAGSSCNRDAIGARVTVVSGSTQQMRTVSTGDGYLSQSTSRLHFGLGDAARVDQIHIRWPDGDEDTYQDVDADQRLVITQHSDAFESLPAPVTLPPDESTPVEAKEDSSVVLVDPLPFPPLSLSGLDGRNQPIVHSTSSSTILAVFSLGSEECKAQVHRLVEATGQLQDAGVWLAAALIADQEHAESLKRELANLKWPYPAGIASEELLCVLDIVRRSVQYDDEPIRLPAYLVLDGDGAVTVLHRAPETVEQVVEDAMTVASGGTIERLKGKWHPRPKRDLATIARQSLGYGRYGIARFFADLALISDIDQPGFTHVLSSLADMAVQRQDVEAAIRYYEESLSQAPDRPGVWMKLARLYARTGDDEQAEYAYLQAGKLDDTNAEPVFQLARLYARRSQVQKAGAMYDKARSLDPSSAVFWAEYGEFLLQQNRLADAEVALEQAIELKPDSVAAHTSLAEAYLRTGRKDDATAVVLRAIELPDADDSVMLLLARLQLKAGKPEECIEFCERALKHNPRNPRAWHLKSAAYSAMGKDVEFYRAWSNALDLAPRNVELHIKVCRDVLIEPTRPHAMLDAIGKLVEHTVRISKPAPELLRIRAAYAIECGEYVEAAEFVEESFGRGGGNALDFFLKAITDWHNGRVPQAHEAYAKALALSANVSEDDEAFALYVGKRAEDVISRPPQ